MKHAQIERLRELHGRMTDYKNSAQFGADRSLPLEVDALLELVGILLMEREGMDDEPAEGRYVKITGVDD